MKYLEIINLIKIYENGQKALENINLDIKKGEIFGIVGLSGAGKSTLIKTINKLESPTSGMIKFCGENILDYSKNQLMNYRKKTAMIFQHFNLLSSRTVFENIELPLEIDGKSKDERKKIVDELIKMVGLENFENTYVNNLSGGQKQRVAIARALSTNPNILLSDESTSSLDPITSNMILELLKNINKKLGITIILITHQMEVIKKICDRVAVMKEGKIIELSTVKDLFLNPKTEFSKKLISELKLEIPKGKKNTVKLHFDGEQANKSYISHLSREFNIDINILGGSIDSLSNGGKVGHLLVEFESDDLSKPLEYLKENNIEVEVIK